MATNNFLPFCPVDGGSNLLTQGEYAAASDRTNGNQPGVASAKLNNKAIRQSTYVVSQLAQMVSDTTQTGVLDDATPAKLLAQLNAVMSFLPPTLTSYLSSTGTHGLSYWFFTGAANATAGATYTHNAVTYTVKATIAGATKLLASGVGAPLTAGTLTKATGSGDATIAFYAVRAPLVMDVEASAGGGGGGGTSTTGSTGGTTSFGSALISLAGGVGGQGIGSGNILGGAGGVATITAPAIGPSWTGGNGSSGSGTGNSAGGAGSSNGLGGSGGGGQPNGFAGSTNTGAGGGGGGASGGAQSNGGGGAGAYFRGQVPNPSSIATFAWAVGAGGAAGTGTNPGGAGGSGMISLRESY